MGSPHDNPSLRAPESAAPSIERARAAFDAAPFGIEVTAGTQVVDVNPRLCEILGRTREELLPRGVAPFVHVEDAGRIYDEIAASRARGETTCHIESRIRRPDGSTRWLRVTVVQVGSDGALQRIAHVEDVTEARAERRALAAAEARLRLSFDGAVIGLCTATPSGRITGANRALGELVGLPAEGLVGRTVHDLLHASAGPVDGLGTTEGPSEAETCLAHPERGEVWVRWTQSTIEGVDDADDEPSALVFCQVQDTTDARLANRALEASQARFEALVARSADVIAVLDAVGTLTYASPAGQRLLGFTPGANLGRSFLSMLHPDDVTEAAEAWRSLLGGGPEVVVEARLETSAGGWRSVEIIATNLLDDPVVGGIVANIRDVSERVEAQARLRRQATHDPLTDLANRALLLARLDAAVGERRGDQLPVAVLFLDLDGFKAVNDRLGHAAGDELLTEVAARLTAAVRSDDLVARIGGDEFVVLAEHLEGEAAATALGDRILAALAEPFDLFGDVASISASVGIAFDAAHSPAALLRAADTALYEAKRQGKARSVVHRP